MQRSMIQILNDSDCRDAVMFDGVPLIRSIYRIQMENYLYALGY